MEREREDERDVVGGEGLGGRNRESGWASLPLSSSLYPTPRVLQEAVHSALTEKNTKIENRASLRRRNRPRWHALGICVISASLSGDSRPALDSNQKNIVPSFSFFLACNCLMIIIFSPLIWLPSSPSKTNSNTTTERIIWERVPLFRFSLTHRFPVRVSHALSFPVSVGLFRSRTIAQLQGSIVLGPELDRSSSSPSWRCFPSGPAPSPLHSIFYSSYAPPVRFSGSTSSFVCPGCSNIPPNI